MIHSPSPQDGDTQIKRAAEEAAPGAQVVRSDGDLLVYYAGFNLSKFVRFLALQPYIVSTRDAAQVEPSEAIDWKMAYQGALLEIKELERQIEGWRQIVENLESQIRGSQADVSSTKVPNDV